MRRALPVALALAAVLVTPDVRADDEAPTDAELAAEESDTLPEPLLIGPRTGEAREKARQRGGGNNLTDTAVDEGLDWLARHVGEDGLWDADGFAEHCTEMGDECQGIGKGHHGEDVPCPFDHAISGLATLAFLGRGHMPADDSAETPDDTPKDTQYGALVLRSLEALRGSTDAWALAISTQAFAEAEVMERKGRWTSDMQSGVDQLLSRRQEDGAWGYAAPWRPGSDVVYTAFVVQALVTARDAGAELPEDLASGVGAFLDTLERKKGRLAYLQNGRDYGYTPTTTNAHLAAAIRELLGVDTSGAAHRAHMALLAKKRPSWKISFKEVNVPGRGKINVQIGHLSMYQWWYGTIATYQAGGTSWSGWFGKVKTALVGHREKSGCARGSWNPEGEYERQVAGRVFATAMGCLMLEQPYRHRRIER